MKYALWVLLTIVLTISYSVGLRPGANHVCSHTVNHYHQEKYTTHYGWWTSLTSGTRVHYRQVRTTSTVYTCCSGWAKSYSSASSCDLPICYGKTSHTGACSRKGECTTSHRCNCHTGYYGTECQICTGQGSDKTHSIYWRASRTQNCAMMCSWRNPCWPGDCSTKNERSSCTCRSGFEGKSVMLEKTRATVCDLNTKPELLGCSIVMKDKDGESARSKQGTNAACSFTSDTYVHLQPVDLQFSIDAQLKNLSVSKPPPYIKQQGYGIIGGSAVIQKTSVQGTKSPVTTVKLNGGTDCKHTMSNLSPEPSLTCVQNRNVSAVSLKNGERLCVDFIMTGGGFFKYQDFNHVNRGTHTYSHRTSTKHLCFRYDNQKPDHCSKQTTHKNCSADLLFVKHRILTEGNITIEISGWSDPIPKGGHADTASGLKTMTIHVLETDLSASKITVIQTDKGKKTFNITSALNETLALPGEGLFAVVLEVTDIAGNTRTVRQFVLYYPNSTIVTDASKPINIMGTKSTPGQSNTGWQTNLGPICVTWKGRYYNNKFKSANPLKPVASQVGVDKEYDQTTGLLPISGTTNVKGIIDAKYSLSVDSGLNSKWTPVPHFQNQSLCLKENMHDGQTYELSLFFTDIMRNELNDTFTVFIDSTVPDISNMWLTKDGKNQIYVHDSLDLTKMALQFDVLDPHSGIQSVEWHLGTTDSPNELGTGVSKVEKLNGTACQSANNCYCPSVSAVGCQFFNHTIKFHTLSSKQTQVIAHNQQLNFTIIVTNGAGLKSIEHLDILVDTTPPRAGTVREGTSNSPDIDYTSQDTILVNWDGFFDHESGIQHYLVNEGQSCLSAKVMENATGTKYVAADVQSTSFSVNTPGRYITTVVAYNAALTPSTAVCSDGIIKDASPPVIHNVVLRYAKTASEHIACSSGEAWLVRYNLTMEYILKTLECENACMNDTGGLTNILPKGSKMVNDTDLADSMCQTIQKMRDGVLIYLPSDKIVLSWNITENESQIMDVQIGLGSDVSAKTAPDILSYESSNGHSFFKVNHAGLTGKTIFYVFLKAINKAQLSSIVTYGPVVLDNTPPLSTEKVKPYIKDEYVYVTWTNSTFQDPEQTNGSFTILFRVEHAGKQVTPILQIPNHVLKHCRNIGFAGCIRYPQKLLQAIDSELNQPFIFELYVYNAAGHFTVVRSEELQMPSAFTPGHGVVYDVDPNDRTSRADVNFHSSLQTACVRWHGFRHHRNVTFDVAIGLAQNTSDVIPFRTALNNAAYCITSKGLKPGTKYYMTVRASCSGGSTYASSNGFVIIDKQNLAQYNLHVLDGRECTFEGDKVTVLQTATKINSTGNIYWPQRDLQVGHAYFLKLSNVTNVNLLSSKLLNLHSVTLRVKGKLYHGYQFTPRIPKPIIRDKLAVTNMTGSEIYDCSLDKDYILSRNKLSANWIYRGILKTTHFEAVVKRQSTCNNGTKCYSAVSATKKVHGQTSVDFTNLKLESRGQYVISVRPCFDQLCLPWMSSNGVKFVSARPHLSVSTSLLSHGPNCQNIRVHVDGVACEEHPHDKDHLMYQWSIANKNGYPKSEWHFLDAVQTSQADVCVPDSSLSADGVKLCVSVVCPSGLTKSDCSTLQQVKKTTNVLELSRNKLQDIKASMPKLQDDDIWAFDLDYADTSTVLSGVFPDLKGRNGSWFLMTAQNAPVSTCRHDPECVASVEGYGPTVTFTGVTLQNGVKYYICARNSPTSRTSGTPSATLSECSNGVIIDDSDPGKGHVEVLNSDNGFLTEKNVLSIAWSGFDDRSSTIFLYGVGTYPGGQDCIPFTNVGFVYQTVVANTSLVNGKTYYVSIKAYDSLGHNTTATSDPVVVDVTPPEIRSIMVGDSMMTYRAVDPNKLNVYWTGVKDPESGIRDTYIAIGSPQTDSVTPFKQCSGTSADLSGFGLVDGHQYIISLKTTNHAGLTSIFSSQPFTADSSPPVTGQVRDGGDIDKEELDFQTLTNSYTCHWSGFHDPHSELSHFEVGLGTSADSDNVEAMTYVGLNTEFTWTGHLPLGTKLFCRVEVCNQAGLCSSSSSDGIILDNSPPVPGVVFVGSSGHHEKYHGHVSTLSTQWHGFEDPQTGINHFDWCIGTSAQICDILPSTNNLLSDSVIKTGLNLPVNVPLYATVNATNPVGLVSTSISDSFKVDASPPSLLVSPSFRDPHTNITSTLFQWENSMLNLQWKFEDPESPIERHLITLSTHTDGTAAIESIHLGAQHSAVVLFEPDNLMRSGDSYTATVTSCNAAGLCSSARSNPILIDSSPPHMGGIHSPLQWKQVQGSTRLDLKWSGFTDTESKISTYYLAVSRTYSGDELSGGFVSVHHDSRSDVQRYSLIVHEKLAAGEKIILTIKAKNNARLSTGMGKVTMIVVASNANHTEGTLRLERHSCAVHYCTGSCTCPAKGQTCSVAQKNCTNNSTGLSNSDVAILFSIDGDKVITSSSSCFSANWTPKSTKVLNAIKRYEWSLGQYGQGIGVGVFKRDESIWRDTGKDTNMTFCLANGGSLQPGIEYVVYVRAWTGFSKYMVYQSHPIRVDHTPPSVKRAKAILDADEHCTRDKEFFQKGQKITACWDGVFSDDQSEITGFEYWLGTSQEGDDIVHPVSLGNTTTYTIPLIKLVSGTKYFSSVRATNRAGLTTTAVSDGFLVDAVPPLPGIVFNTDRYHNVLVQSSNATLRASWHGFQDYDSYNEFYEIAVVPEGDRVVNSLFKYNVFGNEISINNLHLQENKKYGLAVRAVDAAGLASPVVLSPLVRVDTTPPDAFSCSSYNKKQSLTMASKRSNSLQDSIEFNAVEVLRKGLFYEITVQGGSELQQSHIHFAVGKLRAPGRFHKTLPGSESSYKFMHQESGPTNISVVIIGNSQGTAPSVAIQECQTLQAAPIGKALDIRQIRPSVISICARVHDAESGIRSIWLGAGTSKGGYQIRPLSPIAASNHDMILAKEPHGSPVYVTAMAENNAGLRTIFTSSPIVIDHTPPDISNINAKILYSPGQSNNISVILNWAVLDDESDIDVCIIRIKESGRQWQQCPQRGRCDFHMTSRHGSILHPEIRCLNRVGLETQVKFDPLQVILQTPVLPPDAISVIVDNQLSTKANLQTYADHVRMSWKETRDPGLLRYECRVLEKGTNITRWISTGTRNSATLGGLHLHDESKYELQVRAVNERNQYSNIVNTSILVDSRKPVRAGGLPTATRSHSQVTVDWSNVFSNLNTGMSYTITIGQRRGYADVANQIETQKTHLTVKADSTSGFFVTILAELANGKSDVFSAFVSVT